jgi:DNA polymerase III subunit delta'
MTRAAELLLETARRGELHHSIILHGPVASQLLELALETAMALNCENRIGDDDCPTCRKVRRGAHPDVHRIAVEENRKMIAVDQIRAMVSDATMRPYEGRAKVFIVEAADAISGAGANAMLKTLEEPSSGTVFMLLTRSADLLLPTICSRSQAISIQPQFDQSAVAEAGSAGVPLQLVRLRREILAMPGLDSDVAEAIARRVIDAVDRFASRRDIGALLGAASETVGSAEPPAALTLIGLVLRDLATLPPELALDPAKSASIQSAIDPSTLLAAASIALRNAGRLEINADVRLLAEQAMSRVARIV